MARAATRSAGGKAELDATMRIVVLHGRELFLLWEWSRMLAERLREAHGDVGVVRFDGASAPVAEVLDVAAVEHDAAGSQRMKPRDAVEKGGLARAVRSDQTYQFAFRNRK